MMGIIFIIIAYLLGSLSSAVLVCQFMKLPDPRTQGSGNPGAANVFRTAGRNAALFTLLGDVLKGFIPVILARLLGVQGFMLGLVAVAAFVGHLYPVFFKFKGGKGVATAIGTMFALSFTVGIAAVIAWVAVAAVFRYASLASIVTVIVAPLFAMFFHAGYFLALIIMAAIVIWRHWGNIDRLMKGTEEKLDINQFFSSKKNNDNQL